MKKKQEIRKKAEEGIIATLTVCSQSQPGCNFIGGEGIQQAVNSAPLGSSTQKTKIIIKPGTYTRQNYTEFTTNVGYKKKCFVGIQEKYLIFEGEEGEEEVVLDGTNSAYMDGFCVSGGEVKIINLKIKGFKREEGCEWFGNPNQACSGGIAIFLTDTTADIINTISENNRNCVYLAGSSNANINNNTISENNVDGVYLAGSSKAEIVGNQISKNGWQGIILFDSSSANINNNTILENNQSGIAINDLTQVRCINNTIYKNIEFGIRLNQCGSSNPVAVILNNIITNTSKMNETNGFGIGGDCLYEGDKLNNDAIAFNLIWGNEGENTDCQNKELCNFMGKISADPLFINPEQGDFHLLPNSPAIDAGEPTCLDYNGSRCDLGAYGGNGCLLDPQLPGCPSSTPHPFSCQQGDLNQDGKISEIDIFLVLQHWNPTETFPSPTLPSGCSPDINNDGRISETDIFIILNNWNP